MKRHLAGVFLILSLLLVTAVPAAYAVLERVGPVNNDPSVGGYPAWYQDTTGLALEFCNPLNQAEVDGGWCLLLPGDVVIPEVFPTNFFDEHFWYAADTGMDLPGGGRALLVLAVEAAFAADVTPGGQITFSRIRVRLDPVPVSGTYRFIHPYGEELIEGVAGDRIFFTDDVGIAPGNFTDALNSRLGPFLLPSLTPGGFELPAVPGPVDGKLYIADPGRSGPVTGSPLPPFIDSTGAIRDHNIFRIEGPPGSNLGGPGIDFIETADFTLMGRIFQGTISGRVTLDRVSYVRTAGAIPQQKVDVFATAVSTLPGRLPGQPRPANVMPQLSFFDAPCGTVIVNPGTANEQIEFVAPVGATETLMSVSGTSQWGQVRPAVIPSSVCVKDNSAVPTPVFLQEPVRDEVSISEASFDPQTQVLTVKAASSDEQLPPTLTLEVFNSTLVNGQIQVAPLAAPPANVRVISSARGTDVEQVTTAFGAAPGGNAPVATPDSIITDEDTPSAAIDLLANDANAAGGTVTVVQPPTKGSFNLATGVYTPNANANGADSFTYTVTTPTGTSNIATVSVTITPVNDVPVAVDESVTTIANVATPINVLANDTDADGQADIVAVANLTQPVPAGASVQVVGNVVIFTATQAGVYNFTYQAQDFAGAVSANTATVTVTVAAEESVNIALAEFRSLRRRLRVAGTITPVTTPPQTLTIRWNDGTDTPTVVATAVPDAAGAWAFDLRGVTGIQDPRNTNATQVIVTSPGGGRQVAPINIR